MTSGRQAAQGVDGLAQLLRKVGLDMAAENLADALWLAEQIGDLPGASNPEAGPEKGSSSKPRVIEVREEKGEERDRTDDPQFPLTQPRSQSQQEQRGKSGGIPVKVPAAPALRIRLDLARALRPLMRKVPSPGRVVIDEAATVSQIAEQRIWSPVLVPAPERWLDLALVVEESPSTPLWYETIAEFQTLAERQGAFRTVSTWRLTEASGAMALFPSWRGSVTGQRSRSPKEIVDPGGRRLILLLSDCTSSLWREGKIYPWLAEWGRHAPTAVMQLLPERLWSQSGLGMGLPVWLSALTPGTPSAQLDAEERVPLWSMLDEEDKVSTTAVPVVTLQAEPLKQWAKVVAGVGEVKTSGVQFELRQGSSASGGNGHEAAPQLDPSERVQRFRTTASFTAQKLAGLMAAAPVSPPIVDLIRQTLLPDAEPVHVAEVFMGGLMHQVGEASSRSAPALTQYDFVDGVRPLLVDTSSKRETERVLDTVSAYISERIGRSTKSFEALLSLNVRGDETAEEMVLPFAQIAGQVLKRMGGDYAAIADRLETAPKRTLVGRDGEQVGFPLLQSFTFREATVVVERSPLGAIESIQGQESSLTEFEFEVVTIQVGEEATDFVSIAERLEYFLLSQDKPYQLDDIQWKILRGSWEGETFEEIAHSVAYSTSFLRSKGGNLWRLLSDTLSTRVTKGNLRKVLANWTAQAGAQVIRTRKRQQSMQFVELLGESNGLEMVSIPGGTFMMGSPKDEIGHSESEGPQHEVTIQPFFMSKYLITQAQWRAVAALPQVNRELKPDPSAFKDGDRPVEQVSWYDAKEFCDRLSQATSKDYRLPSEAEWEYACRAGTQTPFHFGETITSDLANYRGNRTYGNGPEGEYREETTAVGTFPANAFGLHDMHGNLWEWCLDHWHGNYEKAPADGSPWLIDNEDALRVLRGGSWLDYPGLCRSAIRSDYGPADHDHYIGFRVVCGSARTSNLAG